MAKQKLLLFVDGGQNVPIIIAIRGGTNSAFPRPEKGGSGGEFP